MTERVMPEHFGGALWADQTMVHPIGLAALLAALLALFVLPRRFQLIPLLLIAVALPGAQRIVVLSLDFTFVRIMIMATLSVAILNGQLRTIRWGLPDSLILAATMWNMLASGILVGSIDGVITSAGGAFDTFGAYLVGRAYLHSFADMRRLLLCFALLSLPMLAFFVLEQLSGRNVFSVFGGVPAETLARYGRLRAQGPFMHPIMAGICWATILPCLVALWQGKVGTRLLIAAGIASMPLIVMATASSTPVVALMCGFAGLACYAFRHYMRAMALGMVAVLTVLHFSMDTPVWHLLSRIDITGGSTGWHRYNLIQQSINHVGEWWAFGTTATAHWGWGMQDITNQYVLEGVDGGVVQLLLFSFFLLALFVRLGRAQRFTRSHAQSRLLWGMAVALFVHCVSFLAVSYFGQMVCLFYLFCGAVVAVTELRRRLPAATRPTQKALTPATSN
ncbi:hypothetical protein Mag101_14620 [Microbulbifer agarilyticus]|uniref:O-antigen polymerase n=1 Tax=Microbulbifer agarilyticus TaxID=260552 RepID=A0A1Q2M8X1_9GAMM|nr:hypothetical protein [Microbulbifer agarilyticus]AQQ68727.1 hypothetical protein Mag101_14620 [Microbulbifer agarilyticus]